MKHRFVLTMLAKKRHVFAEIHILEIIRNKAAIAALHALAEFLYNFFTVFRHIAIVYETEKKCKSIQDLRLNLVQSACKSFHDMRRI